MSAADCSLCSAVSVFSWKAFIAGMPHCLEADSLPLDETFSLYKDVQLLIKSAYGWFFFQIFFSLKSQNICSWKWLWCSFHFIECTIWLGVHCLRGWISWQGWIKLKSCTRKLSQTHQVCCCCFWQMLPFFLNSSYTVICQMSKNDCCKSWKVNKRDF